MSLCHYLYRSRRLNARLFDRVRGDVETILHALQDDYGLSVAGPNGDGKPILTSDVIAFNGSRRCKRREIGTDLFCRVYASNNSGEPFLLHRIYEPWPGQQASERPVSYDTSALTKPTLYCTICSTGYKPYDLLVTSSLLIVSHYLKNSVVIRSDYDDADFDHARILCMSRLGYDGWAYSLDDERGLIKSYYRLSDSIADVNLSERIWAQDSDQDEGDDNHVFV